MNSPLAPGSFLKSELPDPPLDPAAIQPKALTPLNRLDSDLPMLASRLSLPMRRLARFEFLLYDPPAAFYLLESSLLTKKEARFTILAKSAALNFEFGMEKLWRAEAPSPRCSSLWEALFASFSRLLPYRAGE